MTSLMDLKYDGGGGYLSTLYWLCGWREERPPRPHICFQQGPYSYVGGAELGAKHHIRQETMNC